VNLNVHGIEPKVEICRWKYGAPFAYSITYDEGMIEVLANALPIHEEFKFPGHVNVVTGQLGQVRDAYGSTLNGLFHMSPNELKFLISKGWGVGNHSWSHYVYPCQPGLDLFREVVWSKYCLEDMINSPVRIFAIPNDLYNYEPVIDLVKRYYLACVGIEGAPNRGSFDLYNIANYVVGSGVIPQRWSEELKTPNLTFDFLKDSWLYETTHIVRWNVPQDNKNVTPKYLTERFSKLVEISGGKLWVAKPDDVIDYELMRRKIYLKNIHIESNSLIFDIEGEWPVGVLNSFLTLRLSGIGFEGSPRVTYELNNNNNNAAEAFKEKPGLHQNIEKIVKDSCDWLFTMQLAPGYKVKITDG